MMFQLSMPLSLKLKILVCYRWTFMKAAVIDISEHIGTEISNCIGKLSNRLWHVDLHDMTLLTGAVA